MFNLTYAAFIVGFIGIALLMFIDRLKLSNKHPYVTIFSVCIIFVGATGVYIYYVANTLINS
ncbi:hypothetical protein DFP96_1352 [Listeria rocourtiae]|uniref:Uncharacterized protein n=1 Tax=Listeria rocourtiae TaxID=647910 RepID=A0A4V3DNX4_9LIST|nr:hypothetical protein DFP96_1352 [Listeria rocourtiae]